MKTAFDRDNAIGQIVGKVTQMNAISEKVGTGKIFDTTPTQLLKDLDAMDDEKLFKHMILFEMQLKQIRTFLEIDKD